MKYTNYIFIIAILLFLNCGAKYSNKEFKNDYIKLKKSNLSLLSGIYDLYPAEYYGEQDDYTHPDSLKNYVNLFSSITTEEIKSKYFNIYKQYDMKFQIELELIDSTHIDVILRHNKEIIQDEIVIGQLKDDGMFHLDNEYSEFRGIPFLFGGYSFNKRRIALSKQYDIIINEATLNDGAIFLLIGAGRVSYNTSYRFKRIKQ